MNEVDARIKLSETKARASNAQVTHLQEMSVRAADASIRAAQQAANVPIGLLTSQFQRAYADAGKAQRSMTAATTAYNQAVQTGTAKIAAAAQKKAEDAQKEFEKMAAAAESAGKRMDAAVAKKAGLERRSNELAYASGQYGQRAGNTSDMASAYALFDQARAATEAQNAAEYRVRAINAISSASMKAGLVIEGSLVAATKIGGDFNVMLERAVNNTSLTGGAADKMRDSIKRLGQESGADLTQLARSFQTIENYGYSVAQSETILRQSMMASVATGSDLHATSELLAGTMKNFHIPVDQSAHAINFLYEVSRQAKGELQDLVKSMGPAFATAANKGVSLTETGAAFVLFTRHQIDASKAVNQFINVMNKLGAPTKDTQKKLADVDRQVKDLGISLTRDFTQQGLREKGIAGIFRDIEAAAQRLKMLPQDLVAKLIPNLRGTLGGTTIAKNLKEYIDAYEALAKASGNSTTVQDKYAEMLKQSSVQLDRLKNMSIIFAGDIATVLTPTIEQLVGKTQTLKGWWDNLSSSTRQNIVEATAWTGAGLILMGILGKMTVGVAALRTAFIELGWASESVTFLGVIGGLGKLAIAAAVVIGTLYALKKTYDIVVNPTSAPKTPYVPFAEQLNQGLSTQPKKPGFDIMQDYLWASGGSGANPMAKQKAKLENQQKTIRDTSDILKAINVELNTRADLDNKRRALLMKSRNAHIEAAHKMGYDLPTSISGVVSKWDIDPFINSYTKGMPSVDKLANLGASTPKAKRPRAHKLTEDEKEARDANNYIDGLRQSLQKVNVEGRTGELMWMAHDNALMKVGGHYFTVAQNIIKTIEAAERQKETDKQGIDLLQEWIKQTNKQEGVTEYDIARTKVRTLVGQGFNVVLAGMTNGLISQAEATDKANKAQKQYADILEMVNKPLQKESNLFQEVLKKAAQSKEFMEKFGLMGALGMAGMAQQNFDAAKAATKYAEAQAELNREVERYNAIAIIRKEMTNVEKANYDLNNNKFGGLRMKPDDDQRLMKAAWFADQTVNLQKSGEAWGDWGKSVLSTYNTTINKVVELKKTYQERSLHIWKELAGNTEGIFDTMFHDMREHGFKSFFSSIVGGFDKMLFDMASKWASSQLIRLIVGAVGGSKAQDALGMGDIFSAATGKKSGGGNIWGSIGGMILGAFAGGAGAGSVSGSLSGDAAGAAFGGFFANGGFTRTGESYIVGEKRAEVFTPGRSGTVSPIAMGGTTIHNWYFNNTNPQQFLASRSEIQAKIARSTNLNLKRNG